MTGRAGGDQPVRVGIVCPYSLTIPGGVQAQVLGLARELRRRGHETRVVGPCDGPPPAEFITSIGNSLPTAANGSIAPLAPDPSAALRTMRALNDEVFDIVHLHEPLAPGPTITTLFLDPAPMVGTFHAAGTSTSYRLFKPLLLRGMARIDAKVVVSKDARELAHSHLGGEYEVLFNGVEVDAIRRVAPFASAERVPVIFFCGRHEERKGLSVLIDAFARLDVDAALWIASDGPDTARLVAQTAGDPRIRWLGRISDEEKFARLRRADVFCAPSLRGESFGVVLVEAMAAGTTVVASGLDGYRNVATDGVDALLVAPGDTDALAAALTRAISDDELATRLRRAADGRAEEFAMSELANRYLTIYRGLIDQPPPRRAAARS